MTETQKLLTEMREFAEEFGMSVSTLGWKACRNGNIEKRITGNQRITLETAETIRQFMRKYREQMTAG